MTFKELKIGQKFLLPNSYYKWTKIQELGFNAEDYTGHILKKFNPDDEVIRVRHISGRKSYNPREFGIQTNHQYPLCQGNTSLTLQESLCGEKHDSIDQVLSRPKKSKFDKEIDFFFEDLEFVEE